MNTEQFIDEYARYVWESPVLDNGDAIIVSWNNEDDEVTIVSTPRSSNIVEYVHKTTLYELSTMRRNRLVEERDVFENSDVIPPELGELMLRVCKVD